MQLSQVSHCNIRMNRTLIIILLGKSHREGISRERGKIETKGQKFKGHTTLTLD